MRAHRGILVLQVAAILKRGAGVYAKGGERRERVAAETNFRTRL